MRPSLSTTAITIVSELTACAAACTTADTSLWLGVWVGGGGGGGELLELPLFPPQAHSATHRVKAIHSTGRRKRFLSQWKALNMRCAYWYHSFDSHSMFCSSDGVAASWKSA